MKIKVQGYKLPSKSPYQIKTEKLILSFNLGLSSSAACYLEVFFPPAFENEEKTLKLLWKAFTLHIVGRVTCCTK